MLLQIYTIIHVIISLIGIATGFVVLYGFLTSEHWTNWTGWFWWTTMVTNMTGFFFPFHGWKPSYTVGLISTAILLFAYAALHKKKLAGVWRAIYVISSTIALYLNTFVLVVQSFLKIPALHALAPTMTEPPFKFTQLTVLVLFIVLGIAGAFRFQTGGVEERLSGAAPVR